MLKELQPLRDVLDNLMLPHIRDRVMLYGTGYTGRFLKWYAKYYHGIEVEYTVSQDMTTGHGYEQEIFREDVFSLDYKDMMKCKVWMGIPLTDSCNTKLLTAGYKQEDIVDFYTAVYGDDIYWHNNCTSVYANRKTGCRDIQFLEWLEWKYGCNFLSMVDNSELKVSKECGSSYRATTQKELFSIFDKGHIIPHSEDRIFDFGCGKGAAIISFLDYGFIHAGGIEYEPQLYELLTDNMSKLNLPEDMVECILGDAGTLREELDKYNFFYFWAPFGEKIFSNVLKNLEESIRRKKRKVHIIYNNPQCQYLFDSSEIFRLSNQFTIQTRQRVVNIYQSNGG